MVIERGWLRNSRIKWSFWALPEGNRVTDEYWMCAFGSTSGMDGKWLLSTGFCRYNLLVILVETCFHGSNICSFSPNGRVWSIFNGVHQRLAYRAFLWGTRISMGQRLSLIIFSIQPSNVWGSLPHFDLQLLTWAVASWDYHKPICFNWEEPSVLCIHSG